MLYTSGTTSDPKGVILTHGNLRAERLGAFGVIRIDERDAILAILPLFHALAQIANLLLPLTAGTRIVFLETVNSTEMMRAFSERRITAFCVVPQFYYLLHQRIAERVAASGLAARVAFKALVTLNTWLRSYARVNLGRLLFRQAHEAIGGRMRIMVCGGSRFDPMVGRDLFGMGFNIVQAYGLTECSGAATATRIGDPHVDTVGPPLDGVEVRIAPGPRRIARPRVPGRRGPDSRPDRDGGLPQPARCQRRRARRRLAPHRRSRLPRPRGPACHHGPQEGDHRPGVREEHLPGRD